MPLVVLFLIFILAAAPAGLSGAETPVLVLPPETGEAGSANAGETKFYSVVVGRFLDAAPAQRLMGRLQAQGLTAFVTKRRLVESRLFFDRTPAGDFYLTLAGLFGRAQAAERLGSRLKAEGFVSAYQVAEIEDPGEMDSSAAQTKRLDQAGAKMADQAITRASAPLRPAAAEAVEGAYKKSLEGRYVGSFQDPLAARAEARRLTGGGWEASVRSEGRGEGRWYRVYLTPAIDPREMRTDEPVQKAAETAQAGRLTLIFVPDLASTQGAIGRPEPEPDRRDASACAGFSEAGRLGALLSRTINYMPETDVTVALIPAQREEIKNAREAAGRLNDWWEGKERRPASLAAYGPTFFNRPEMERAILRLKAEPGPGSLTPALRSAARPLAGRPGRGVLLLFSNFLGPDKFKGIQAALAALGNKETVIVYGDADGPGYNLAKNLAGGAAWDGCRLLHDDAYFEKYIKAILK